jgi:hypothetical protein
MQTGVMSTTLSRGGSEMPKDIPYINENGGLIEVKTASNNYIKAKNTITSRIGEEFEPDKPIINYNAI